jgi:hypothetical protein
MVSTPSLFLALFRSFSFSLRHFDPAAGEGKQVKAFA